jgi:hypothetical protein
MGTRAVLVVCLLIPSGCFGQAAGSGAGHGGGTVPRPPLAATTDLRLQGPAGPERMLGQAQAAAVCARLQSVGTSCRVSGPAGGTRVWAAYVRRHVVCLSMPQQIACRAVAVLIRALRSPHRTVCYCPLELTAGYRIDGRFRGHVIHVRFDRCMLCGAGPAAARAMAELFGAA